MDQNSLTSAKKYAKALFEVLQENNQLEDGYKELQQFRQVFADNPSLAAVLSSNQTTKELKQTLVDSLSKGGSDLMKNFIGLLQTYQRFDIASLIVDEFEKLYEKDKKIVHASVTSAVKLDDDQQSKIADAFAHRVGANKVILSTKVDPDLIGGIVLQSSDVIIDGSVKSRIDKIKELLLN